MTFRALLVIICIFLLTSCRSSPHRTYHGYVVGDNTYLSSPVAGQLKQLLVYRGQRVKKGQLIFKLDENPQRHSLAEALANFKQAQKKLLDLKSPKRPPEIDAIKEQIAQAEAQIDLAQIRAHRNQTLYEKHVLDKDSLDASVEKVTELSHLKAMYEANLALAKLGARKDLIRAQAAQVKAIYAKYQQAAWQLSQKQLVAPFSGIIFDTYFNMGEYVPALRPVASLLTERDVYLVFFVPGDDLPLLKMGGKIQFQGFGAQGFNNARISYVSSEAEYAPPLIYSRDNASKLVFRIQAKIESDPLRFKPGQPVDIIL